MGNDRCGIEFNVPPDGVGITAYNNTGGEVYIGDVVYLTYSGTEGQEVIANLPATNTSPTVLEAVCIEDCAKESIGKFQIKGTCKQANVHTTTDIAKNDFLEMVNGVAFDGTATNLAFVKGDATTEDTITDSDDGLVTDGFKAGMNIVVANATSAANNKTHKIKTVAAGTLTLESYGQLVSEAGNAGTTIKAQGFLQKDGTSKTVNSPAVAKEARTANNVGAIKVYLIGEPVQLAAS